MTNPIAELIGFTYANVQHGMDRVIDWGLHRMREAGNDPPRATKPDTSSKAVRAAKGLLRFMGDTGDAYYRTYEKLKSQGLRKKAAKANS